MIYYILRPIVRIALKLYFGKIYLSGLENIPKDKPIILACNHPTAFIEPCMLACFLPVKLHFLVRGDLFSKSWLSWLLTGTNQIPIFRQKDGLDNVKKNLITQEHLTKLFAEKNALLMFPEAHAHENIFIRPLKKGISRFAFMDESIDLEIVPIGVNFDKNVLFGGKVSVILGQSLSIQDYKDEEFGTTANKHKVFIDDLYEAMKNCVRHIEHEERENDIHNAYRVMDSQRVNNIFPTVEYANQVFIEEKMLANQVDSDLKVFEEMESLFGNQSLSRYKKPSVLDLIWMVLLLPLFCVSLLFHFIPVQISRLIVKRKIKAHEFKMPVFMAAMIFQYIFYLLLLIFITAIVGKNALVFSLCFVIFGILGTYYLRLFQDKWKYLFLNQKLKNNFNQIIQKWTFKFLN